MIIDERTRMTGLYETTAIALRPGDRFKAPAIGTRTPTYTVTAGPGTALNPGNIRFTITWSKADGAYDNGETTDWDVPPDYPVWLEGDQDAARPSEQREASTERDYRKIAADLISHVGEYVRKGVDAPMLDATATLATAAATLAVADALSDLYSLLARREVTIR